MDATATDAAPGTPARPNLAHGSGPMTLIVFLLLLAGGIGYGVHGLLDDLNKVGEPLALGAFALLGLALLIALGFEFVNGFHDTANAVATVIYTHSLPPLVAVVWSGFFNFLGVLLSSGTVAYAIVTLLPVELILAVGSGAGYAMIFALLLAAIIWNLGTWALGIPNSSSHALIGSVLGVGLANQLLAPPGSATSGVDWGQALKVGEALLFSPIIGFIAAGGLLLACKALIKNRELYEAPKSDAPPPWWIRGLLVLTCTGVSFAHGGNDGQKGMGLIMLILIGVAPTAYALNRTMPASTTPAFLASSAAAGKVFARAGEGAAPELAAARQTLAAALPTRKLDAAPVYAALGTLSADVAKRVETYGSVARTPAAATPNMRNDMYQIGEAVRLLGKAKPKTLSDADQKTLKAYDDGLNARTRYIPDWVKVAVAVALGLGTMVGWKRIVVTVGERIGKTHLTYAQGASAELVAMVTIGAAEVYGLPVSTTHILSSGVAGTMAANGSGLQWSTVRNIALAWVTTLPAAIVLAGLLYWLLRALLA